MKKCVLGFFLVANYLFSTAQTNGGYHSLLNRFFNDSNAYKTTAFVEQFWRLAGNKGFNESIYYVEKILQQAGFVKEKNDEKEATLTYRIEKRKMKQPTWEPINASVTLEGDSVPLLQFSTNRNMIAVNSASTVAEGVTAEIIDVGTGTAKELQGKDIKGKIVFAETFIGAIYNTAIKNGAAGVLAYNMPSYTQPEKNSHSIQFQLIPYTGMYTQQWGIALSYNAKEKIKAALAKGTVKATVLVDTKIYESEELTLIANVRGNSKPGERFVFSAHVQEPGANDNATGVATLAEMARVTAALVQQKKFTPQRTLTFLWGDEILSTKQYIVGDSVRAKGIKWGVSLDMVGEEVTKTGGSFLIEKMPDPSAIWTRGKDKHTEWGGEPLKEQDLFPHYFTDVLLNDCRKQSAINGWEVNTNPFEGGSDHTPFLEAKIPGLLMWHFTDQFYHTDADRLNNVSAPEMKNVGVSALATAYTLTAPTETVTIQLIKEVGKMAIERLQTEIELGKNEMANGGSSAKEKHILETWKNWYVEAITKMKEINTGRPSKKISLQINKTISQLNQLYHSSTANW